MVLVGWGGVVISEDLLEATMIADCVCNAMDGGVLGCVRCAGGHEAAYTREAINE